MVARTLSARFYAVRKVHFTEAASSSTLIRSDSQNKSLGRGTKQREEVIIYGVEAFVSHVDTEARWLNLDLRPVI